MNDVLAAHLKAVLEADYHGNVELLLSDVRRAVAAGPRASASKPSGDRKILVEGKGLTKEYVVGGKPVHALKGVDVAIGEGEFVSIVGTSGSGKSTLMHLIGGLDRPTAGELSVGGVALKDKKDKDLSAYRNRTVGFVFQFFYLQPYLTVRQNVEIPLAFRKMSPVERRAVAEEALEVVGLSDRLEHKPTELSGGQMQRVAIARAIASQPKLLLADEPTGNLDQKTGSEIIALLQDLNERLGVTVVVVTHDMAVAKRAHRTIEIADGQILA